MTDLADLSMVEAADAVRNGEATSMELLDACWRNMDAANPKLNATIWLDRAGAEQAARARRIGRCDEKAWLGPLHGVPMAHKDMYYQAGKLSTCGSALRKDFRPAVTATVIEKLAAAGAYAFGGLNMAEFAQNPTGHNRAFGDCHNPWNPPYITGGSSSGSGASVAARFNYMALGSDTGGSIRLPAAACGVTGIKPTQTRVSRYRRDAAVVQRRQCGAADTHRARLRPGHDADRGTRSARPDQFARTGAGLRSCAGWRHARAAHRTAVDVVLRRGRSSRCWMRWNTRVAVLVARGATVQRIALPLMDAVTTYGSIVSRVEAATIHAQWMRERAGEYGIHISGRMYGGYAIPATYYVEALSRRGPILKAFAKEVFAQGRCADRRPPSAPACRRWPKPTSITGRPAPRQSSWRSRPIRGRSTTSACPRSA